MRTKIKADLSGIGLELKTDDYFADNQKAFSTENSTTNLEHIASIIPRLLRNQRTARRFDWKRQKPGRIKAL